MNNFYNQKIPWTSKNNKIMIELPKDFSFEQNLAYLQRNEDECMFKVFHDQVYTVVSGNNNHALVKICVNDNKEMIVEILKTTKDIDKNFRKQLVNYIIEWFDLKFDIELFYKMASEDQILSNPTKEFSGMRLCGVPNFFEALSWGIIGQQINLSLAYKIKLQFVEEFGSFIEYEGEKFWIFPSAEDIAKLTIEDLVNLKMTLRKKEYLLGVAQLIASKVLSKEELLQSPDLKTAEKELTKIRGIGPWTANYVLMRSLRFTEAFPMGDVGLQNAIKKSRELDDKPSKEDLLVLQKKWQPFQAYATFYLWRTIY